MTREEIVAEIQDVARRLNVDALSITQFERHGRIGISRVVQVFGTWNQAIQQAGLTAHPSNGGFRSPYSDEDLLREIIRLTHQLDREPTAGDMDRNGIASSRPYKRRWGNFLRARELAYERFPIRVPFSADK
jgi:hypothetical protein